MIDPELLLQGYRLGVFPMAMEDNSIQWFSPDPRAILPLEDFHVPHVLRRLVRKKFLKRRRTTRFQKSSKRVRNAKTRGSILKLSKATRDCMSSVVRILSKPGRKARSLVDSTAWPSAAPFLANQCSIT